MTWLFPLYLLGAGAIVLPILLHLRRREPKEKVVFSSLMFLERSPQLLTQRSKLERLLLLALRCLALILLALMFTRPFLASFADKTLSESGESVVLLLDASASMRRADLWTRALKIAEDRVARSKAKDRVSVMRFDQEIKTLWSFDRDAKEGMSRKGPIKALLSQEKPGWGSTDLGKALVSAAGAFSTTDEASPSGNPRRIVLVSDLQEGARLEALRGFAWPDDVEVEWVPLELQDPGNFSLGLAASESDDETGIDRSTENKTIGGVRVRVSNVRDSSLEKFSLKWEGMVGPGMEGYLPAAASRVLRSAPAPGVWSGDVLTLNGDAWDFDNRVYVAPSQPRKVRVVASGDRDAAERESASPLFYLKRALQPTSALLPSLEVGAPLAGASLALVQSESLNEATSAALKSWVEAGGLAVVVASQGRDAKALANLTGAASLTAMESDGDGYAMLGDVKTDHPLLSPFADIRLRDFTKIRFWHHRKVAWAESDARKPEVLARFDQGDPALMLWPVGKGQLIVMASGWHPADSQLALSTKFVPLLFGWLQAAGFSHEAGQSVVVGDEIGGGADVMSVLKPDGTQIEKANLPLGTDSPGFYRIAQQNETRLVAVNLAPEEGRTHPMNVQKLSEAGVKLASEGGRSGGAVMLPADKLRVDARENEARQKAWLWVLIALLGVLAWETWLAGRKPRAQNVTA